MRTPQRVEQFHKELEDKKARAARDALRSQQASAGSTQDLVVESPKESVEVVPDPAPTTLEDVPAQVFVEEASAEVENHPDQDQPESLPAETVVEPVVTEPATTSRKRRS